MSGINGDKSRFHRQRKQKLARRRHTTVLLKGLAKQPNPAATSPKSGKASA